LLLTVALLISTTSVRPRAGILLFAFDQSKVKFARCVFFNYEETICTAEPNFQRGPCQEIPHHPLLLRGHVSAPPFNVQVTLYLVRYPDQHNFRSSRIQDEGHVCLISYRPLASAIFDGSMSVWYATVTVLLSAANAEKSKTRPEVEAYCQQSVAWNPILERASQLCHEHVRTQRKCLLTSIV